MHTYTHTSHGLKSYPRPNTKKLGNDVFSTPFCKEYFSYRFIHTYISTNICTQTNICYIAPTSSLSIPCSLSLFALALWSTSSFSSMHSCMWFPGRGVWVPVWALQRGVGKAEIELSECKQGKNRALSANMKDFCTPRPNNSYLNTRSWEWRRDGSLPRLSSVGISA